MLKINGFKQEKRFKQLFSTNCNCIYLLPVGIFITFTSGREFQSHCKMLVALFPKENFFSFDVGKSIIFTAASTWLVFWVMFGQCSSCCVSVQFLAIVKRLSD